MRQLVTPPFSDSTEWKEL